MKIHTFAVLLFALACKREVAPATPAPEGAETPSAPAPAPAAPAAEPAPTPPPPVALTGDAGAPVAAPAAPAVVVPAAGDASAAH